MNINKATLNAFRSDFEEAVKALEEKHGMTIKLAGISYTDESFSSKVTFTNNDENGNKVSQIAIDFQKQAGMYGLKASDLGRTFFSNGQSFTISGLKPRNHKMPIIATSSEGRSFKFCSNVVKEGLAK